MNTPSQYLTPRALCKVGGAMYLLVILLGLCQQLFVRGKLFVPGDIFMVIARLAFVGELSL